MIKKMKTFFGKYKYLFITLLCSFMIIGILFFIKNIYPFGELIFSVGEFDSVNLPMYYELWDLLHSNGNVFVNFDLGNGVNLFSLLVTNGFLSPINWIIALFSRNSIPYVISWLVIIKILFISLCMFVSINKLFPKVKPVYKVIFTLIYTFSGWTLLMISNMGYLEVVALFPLLILGYKRLIKNNKWGLYFIILLLSFIFNFYMAWMIVLFIIILTIFSFILLDIKNKKRKVIEITFITIAVIGLTSIISVPALFEMRDSYLLENEIVKSVGFKLFSEKLIHIFPLALPLVLVVKQLLIKKDKKINLFMILMLIVLLLGLFIEPINQIWHLGEYVYFSFRYSYIISCFAILGAMYYLENNYENKNKFNVINLVGVILLIGFTIGLFIYFKDIIMETNLIYEVVHVKQIVSLIVIFIVSLVSFILIFRNDNKTANIIVSLYSLLMIVMYGYLYIYNSNVSTTLETQKFIYERMNLSKDNYNYVDNTFYLNLNFSKILNVNSFQSTMEIIDEEKVNYRDTFAYSGWGVSIGSSGGTIFSDLIMNNKYYFSSYELDDTFYELVDEASGIFLYKLKYNLNYVIPYLGKVYDLDYGDVLKNNNELYKTLFDKDDEIIHMIDLKAKDGIYELEIEPNNMYYLYANINVEDISNVLSKYNVICEKMIVDNHIVRITFSSKEELVIELDEELVQNDILSFGYISSEEIEEFVHNINYFDVKINDNKNTRIYDFTLNEDSDVLLPISYSDNYVIKVNGEVQDFSKNVYNMLSVSLSKGVNRLEISYIPKYFKECMLVSIGTLLGMLIIYFTNRKFNFLKNKNLRNILFYSSSIIGLSFIIVSIIL